MAQTATAIINKPAWVELSTPDVEASREFYSRIFGWQIDVITDPQYGGYAMAKLGVDDAAGIGPKQSPDAPTAWGLYIGTDNVDQLAQRVTENGGTVIAPPFDVGDQGRMAVFADPIGAVISVWQGARMSEFAAHRTNAFGWAELNARGLERAIPFYEALFGWTHETNEASEGIPAYTQFQSDGQQLAGAFEVSQDVPAEVPSFWMIYFDVEDVDATAQAVKDAGGSVTVEPDDYFGGRFAIVADPKGATFGLFKSSNPG
ncbi:MAG TPA: VOC family protein [Candidatus Limnocylindria bacterium]